MPKQKPQMTLKSDTGKALAEIYLLNPGESFDGFGGSRHALPIKKTASLIVRNFAGFGISDVEHDIHDPSVWAWIARLINTGAELKVTAAGPEGVEG